MMIMRRVHDACLPLPAPWSRRSIWLCASYTHRKWPARNPHRYLREAKGANWMEIQIRRLDIHNKRCALDEPSRGWCEISHYRARCKDLLRSPAKLADQRHWQSIYAIVSSAVSDSQRSVIGEKGRPRIMSEISVKKVGRLKVNEEMKLQREKVKLKRAADCGKRQLNVLLLHNGSACGMRCALRLVCLLRATRMTTTDYMWLPFTALDLRLNRMGGTLTSGVEPYKLTQPASQSTNHRLKLQVFSYFIVVLVGILKETKFGKFSNIQQQQHQQLHSGQEKVAACWSECFGGLARSKSKTVHLRSSSIALT